MSADPPDSSAVAWRLARGTRLLWAWWEDADEYVLYVEGAADTLLVTRAAYQVLRALEEGPRRTQDLVSVMTRAAGGRDSEVLSQELDATLFHFHKIGLVGP